MILIDLINFFFYLITFACVAYMLYAYLWLPIKGLFLNFLHLLLLLTQLLLKLVLKERIS